MVRTLPLLLFLACALVGAPAVRADCLDAAAEHYAISPVVLRAIAHAESGNDSGAWRRNRDGSLDVGRFQINSSWWPTLGRFGLAPEVLWDPCASAFVAAWILAQEVARFGWSWRAIGAYHTGAQTTPSTEKRRAHYAAHVARHLGR